MSNLLRFLVVYDWREPFDFGRHPELVVRLVENAGVAPSKVTVAVSDRRHPRRRTISGKLSLADALKAFTSYEWLALDEPIDGDFTNVRSQITIDKREYTVIKLRSAFSTAGVLSHLRLICEYLTPRYGFSHSEQGLSALCFPHGTTTSGLDDNAWFRVADLGHSLRRTKEHLQGKLHDVYGVNVLSPLHLERAVEGQSLRAWIDAGGRGELMTIKDEVFAWIVPDAVRPAVRATLFNEGALIASR